MDELQENLHRRLASEHPQRLLLDHVQLTSIFVSRQQEPDPHTQLAEVDPWTQGQQSFRQRPLTRAHHIMQGPLPVEPIGVVSKPSDLQTVNRRLDFIEPQQTVHQMVAQLRRNLPRIQPHHFVGRHVPQPAPGQRQLRLLAPLLEGQSGDR